MTCKNCGFQLKDGAAFCTNCGVGSQSHYSEPMQQPMEPRRKKSSNTAIIVTAICAAVVVVIGSVLAFTLGNRFMTNIADEIYRQTEIRIRYPDALPSQAQQAPATLPTIPLEPVDAVELDGVWTFSHGEIVLFFGMSEFIMFTYLGNNSGEVFESQWEEWGDWRIGEDGRLFLEAEWTGSYVFSLILDKDTLTIIDIDGEAITYIRVEG